MRVALGYKVVWLHHIDILIEGGRTVTTAGQRWSHSHPNRSKVVAQPPQQEWPHSHLSSKNGHTNTLFNFKYFQYFKYFYKQKDSCSLSCALSK
jgi:hypothetical protein